MDPRWRRAGVLAALVVLAYAIFAAVSPDQREWVTNEDGVIEWVGAISFLIASVLLFITAARVRRATRARRSWPLYVHLFAMALLFLLAGGEEISWGQRLFGWGTPEGLSEANLQEETNLHNLHFFGFDEYRVFWLYWITVVLVIPFAAAMWAPARSRLARIVPLVAWPVGLVYVLNDVSSVLVGRVISADDVRVLGALYDGNARIELREAIFAALCAFTAFTIYRLRSVEGDGERAASEAYAGHGGRRHDVSATGGPHR